MKINFDFETSYNQFYIVDGTNHNIPGDIWASDSFFEKLALVEGAIGVITQAYGHIKGDFEVLSISEPEPDLESYEHIVEGGLEIKSGIVRFINCPFNKEQLKIALEPGLYKIRVSSSNLSSTDADEYEGNDFYLIQMWPDKNREKKVIKQFKE